MTTSNRPERAGRSDETTRRRAREQRPETPAPARSVQARAQRYLVAPAQQDPRRMMEVLAEDPNIRVIRTIESSGHGGSPPVAIVEMAADHAARLAAIPGCYVEAEQPLRYGTAAIPHIDPGVAPLLDSVDVTVRVENTDGEALQGAAVHVFATQCPAQGITGADGTVTVTVAANEIDLVDGIYVRPKAGHWSSWLGRPRLSTAKPNTIICAPYDSSTVDSWARRAMGFDRLPPTYRGHGIKIAIIDSGLATVDDLAERVQGGRDHVAQDDISWREDVVGIGTLASGIIAATDDTSGMIGLAPEVELHVCKVFPGGRFGDLVEAIDYCIEKNIDIISLGVGSPYPSLLVAQRLEEARQAGIATIAAAGSTAGPVAFPASLPTVLAVAAIGKLGTFPPESYHATQILGTPTSDGYFPARFSAYGPEIDVCAPGVGVVSTISPKSLGSLDGTAIAVPHVTALAALVLAHHHDFRDGYRTRGAGRVDRLFEIIRSSCRAWPFADRLRIGAGMPDAVVALGLVPGPAQAGQQAMNTSFETVWPNGTHGITQLRAAMRSAGLAPVQAE
ncbi:MAG TPA: Subtilisin, serine endopeptidase [Micromonosporaceae bacterium]|nr:Subtilisin, serine endopeptidase [Micromonosporaceae bacterium]